MKNLYILLIICLISTRLYAQSFYVTYGAGLIKKITVKGTVITEQAVSSCANTGGSIAIYGNYFYYLSGSSIGRADINNLTINNCTPLGNFVSSASLTADINGMLYATMNGNQLVRFNLADKSVTNLGAMPYSAAGDLIFYKGDLFMASTQGIVKVDMSNPSKSTLVIPKLTTVLGLAIVPFNSTQNKVYALSVLTTGKTDIIELDLDNNIVGQTVGTLNYYVGDAASSVENGSFVTVNITGIKITPDCPYTGKGTVQVICQDATADFTYTLNNITNNTGIFTGLDPGVYHIKVTANDESQDTTATVATYQPDKPVLKTATINPVCVNTGEISIAAEKNGNLYSIQYAGSIYAFDHVFTGLKAGKYHFDILNLNGCIVDNTDIVLTQDACNIVVNTLTVNEECQYPDKGNVQATASPGTDTYTYSINGISNGTGLFNNLAKGTYTMNITSLGGGSLNLPVTIPDYRAINPTVTYTTNDAICDITGSIQLYLPFNTTGYKIIYNSDAYTFDHIFNHLYEGTYNFTILKPDGCVLDNLAIPLIKEPCEVAFFPNTFSPNNDGINDVFRPSQNFKATNFKFYVYNRLGTLLFSSENRASGWDGQYNGQPVPAGVYYWKASYINNESKSFLKSGYITLIR